MTETLIALVATVFGALVSIFVMKRSAPKQAPTPEKPKVKTYDDSTSLSVDANADELDLGVTSTNRDLADLADSNGDLRARLNKLQ